MRTAHLDPVRALQHALDQAMPQNRPTVVGASGRPVTISWHESTNGDERPQDVERLLHRLCSEVLGDPEAQFSMSTAAA